MEKNKKIAIILGAGPSGLACAYELLKKTDIKPIIIEKLNVVGGLSRTVYNGDLGVDIGGHRLYTKDKYVEDIWKEFLPLQGLPSIDDIICNRTNSYPDTKINPEQTDNVMLIRKRFSSIIYNSHFFDYPIKLNLKTLSNLGFLTSIKAGFSYIKASLFKREEKSLEDFMVNRFGLVLYNIFFKDYTKKVWGIDPSELSSEWGRERIRKLSLLKTILNAILSQIPFLKFNKETSLIDEFYYPKYGCSQLWELMSKYITENGGEILLNHEFSGFNYLENKITEVNLIKDNCEKVTLKGEYFISSIPICDLIKGIDCSYDIKQKALSLPYRDYMLVSFYVDKFNLKNNSNYKTINNIAPQCWIYLQEPNTISARVQIMNNWSPYLCGDFRNKYLISMEYYANEQEELWKKDDKEITKIALEECKKYNFFDKENVIKSMVIREKKAYPSYFGTYKYIDKIKENVLNYTNLKLIGRNGQHKYNNMDEAMISGINVAREISKG